MSTNHPRPVPLDPGTRIDNLRIERVLGQGSFSISYLVSDSLQGKQYVLKEYCPLNWVERLEDGSLQSLASTATDFHNGLQQFLSEGRTLAGLQHRNVIEVLRCFEARGTAWMLMPWYPGELLSHLLERQGPLHQAQLDALLPPLLDALQYLHQQSVIHQDIKPSNIYITSDGQPVLLDFGAALIAQQAQSGAMGSPGYAAPEQQLGSASIGPWTDIYGLAATLYRAITGEIPPAAQTRLEAVGQGLDDPLAAIDAMATATLRASWTVAIQAGLQLQPDLRPRKVSEWSRMFAISHQATLDDTRNEPRHSVLRAGRNLPRDSAGYDSEGRAWLPIALLGFFMLGLVILVVYLFSGDSGQAPVDEPMSGEPAGAGIEQHVDSRDPELNRRWQEALEADTIFAYQQFRQDYPNSLHEADANLHLARLDDALWQTVDAEGTRSAYESYLEQLPEGRHQADARIRLDVLDRTAAEADRQQELRQQQDNMAWNEARTQRSISAIDRYMGEFPDGQHLSAAQTLRRELSDAANDGSAFAAAQKLDTRKAYQSYLDAFPRGQHVTEALGAIDALTLRPGKRFRDCDVCPDLVVLAAGSFWQGAEDESPTALANEKPQRKVVLERDFAIGIHEVTLAQWDACVAAGACEQTADNGWGRGARPVIMVTWNDAQSYVEWLSRQTGEKYRLPSESEWEYAARASETDEWPQADPAYICSLGNIAGSETGFRWAHQACADPFALETAPVGSFPANSFGIHDSIGNVAEWTLDCMSLSYHDAPADGSTNNRGLCNSRVTRGGSWFSGARESRLTARFNLKAGDRNDFTGFRVVRELRPES